MSLSHLLIEPIAYSHNLVHPKLAFVRLARGTLVLKNHRNYISILSAISSLLSIVAQVQSAVMSTSQVLDFIFHALLGSRVSDLAPTEELFEFICTENNKDVSHLVGK